MSLARQFRFWAISLLAVALMLYLLSDVLLPFVAGMALAHLLDPVADRLQRYGLGRMLATVIILVVFLVIFVLTLILVVPVLGHQLAGLIANLPGYMTKLQGLVATVVDGRIGNALGITMADLEGELGGFVQKGAGFAGQIVQSIVSGGQSLLSVISLLVVTPVVAFYLLYDWDRMIATIDSWLPRDHADTIRDLAGQMNASIAGFLRGQMAVCLLLGIFYAVGLSVVGLNFGFLIGIIAGLISFIPYLGTAVGFVLSMGVAFVQFWPDYGMLGIVFAVFVIGQFIDGNILQPKLIGSSVGLHPVWLMFALFAFGSLFGFVGMLIAVPVSAVIGVLIRFALGKYLASTYYRGVGGPQDPA